jgi:integrase
VLNHFKRWADTARIKQLDSKTLPEHLPSFCQYLKSEESLSDDSIQQYIGIVKTMMRRRGKPIEFTYYVSSQSRKKKHLKHSRRWFDESDVAQMMSYTFPKSQTQERNMLMVRLLFETGARIEEIAAIKQENIDTENRTLWLTTSKTIARPVFISPETADMIRILMASGKWNGFPKAQQCKKIFAAMLEDLGMKNQNDGRGPHTARHYVATWMHYEGGMTLHDVARILGDKPETVRDVYLHPTPAMLKKRVDTAMGWGQD